MKGNKVVTGHIKLKRKYGDRFFREHISQSVRGILANLHPDADNIVIKFFLGEIPSVLPPGVNHIFAIRDSEPQMIAWIN